MKEIILLFTFCISLLTYSQNEVINDSTSFLILIKDDLVSFKERPRRDAKMIELLNKKDMLIAFDIYSDPYNGDNKYIAAYKDTVMGYVALKDVIMDNEELDYLLSGYGDHKIRQEHAEKMSILLLIKKLEALKSKYESYNEKGLVLTKKEYSYKDYSDAFGLELEFYNGYNKDIKYIEITVRPYNRVGDLTKDDFGSDVSRVRVIGPIHSNNLSSVNFNDLFWNEDDIINRLVITYMKVTFMDGSLKELKNVSQHLGEDVFNGK